jgi:hypothetical protein
MGQNHVVGPIVIHLQEILDLGCETEPTVVGEDQWLLLSNGACTVFLYHIPKGS